MLLALVFSGLWFFMPGQSALFNALFLGNLVLFLATLLSFYYNHKGMGNKNIQAFLRMIYSGMFLKMGICLAAVIVYALLVKPVNKIAFLGFFLMYFLYTFFEVRILYVTEQGE